MLKKIHGRVIPGRQLLLLFTLLCHYSIGSPTASFTANQVSGCMPLNVQFTNTSTGSVSWYWDLGNGNSSTLQNPSNIYAASGTYSVTLIAFDAGGNSDTAYYNNYITALGKPTADFISNSTSGCPDNNNFIFSNLSSNGASTYLWDFGDGTTSTAPFPSHSYNFADSFTVTLIATNTLGCNDVKINTHYITIYPKPDPSISASTTLNCDHSVPVQFTSNAQNAATWFWNFNDFSFSNLSNPSHIFPGPGNYPVTLIVSNTHGCSDTSDVPLYIIVGSQNWADFTYDVSGGCVPLTVQFTNTNLGINTCLWSFGDGTTSNTFSLPHTYNTPGIYSVSLVNYEANGCIDTIIKNNLINAEIKPTVNFQYSNTSGCAPMAVQFTNTSINFTSCEWFFGDGTSSTAVNPIHTYTNGGTFSVSLICYGPTGCTNSLIRNNIITVTSPSAIFSAAPRIGCNPLQTTFTSIAQSAGLTYFWNFGDGGTSTQINPVHTYNLAGNFDVTLSVTDTLGCTDTLIRSAYIQSGNSNTNYTAPPATSGCAPFTAQFTDGSAGSTSWLWDFGDGHTSTLQNPSHTYYSIGTFNVSLTTTMAGGGCSQTINNFSTFHIDGGYAGFSVAASPCPPYVAAFQDTSLNAVSWLWDFGDGTTSTQQNPTHTYASPGYHSVSLKITTAGGCSFTTMQNNGVYFPPFGANFYGIQLDTIFPARVQFMANSVGATSWSWDFGDSTVSTLENPLHIFQVYRPYDITLIISNGTCTLTYHPPMYFFGTPDSTPVDVGNGPDNGVQQGCIPFNVQFTNNVIGAVSWYWDFGDGSNSTIEYPVHLYSAPGIYSVSLTTTDSFGITQQLQMDSIVIASGPIAGFSASPLDSCNNTQIIISDSSQNAASWFWDLGDGTFDNVQNPFHAYSSNLPNYIITQTVTDTMGCSASISTSIFSSYVNPIHVSTNEVCGYDTVLFSTVLQNYVSYHWDFGDGQSSNQLNPSHMYLIEGIFNPVLTVTDIGGCTKTFNLSPAITVKLPIAAFNSTGIRQACNETSISFINQSINADSYLWNFGDGSTSSLTSPVHDYNTAGLYNVSLMVYRSSCIDTISYSNYVRVDTAHAAISMTNNQICLPITSTFQDLSTNAVSWRWVFGDGDTSSVQNPVHIYTVRPGFGPALIITDNHGCIDTASISGVMVLQAGFASSLDSGCLPLTVNFTNSSSLITNTWYWDFGDGTTSTAINPTHTYITSGEFDVMLIITSVYASCSDTLLLPKKVKVKQPHADFTSVNLAACAPSIVDFTDLSTFTDNYLWDFGDGATSTNVNPSHIYNTPGVYDVKLLTTSTLGCGDSILKSQYITVLGPISKFGASDTAGCSPFQVSFTDSSINAVSYSWNFGDGYSDNVRNPVHVYQDTGTFTVTLVTHDTSGCTSFYELPQKIVILQSPISSFTADNYGGCQPVNVSFTNNSTGAVQTLWDFGDGTVSSLLNPVHQFTDSGTFSVMLISTNQLGCSDTAFSQQPIQSQLTPVPQISIADTVGCAPYHVTILNNTINTVGEQYLWDLGNGNTSTDPNPLIDYMNSGSYQISVTITNSNGCAASYTYPYSIHVTDTSPPVDINILSVSVLSNSEVKIIWENNPVNNLTGYVLYRNDPAQPSIFSPIYYMNIAQNGNLFLPCEYTDNGLNTLQYTYSYKVQPIITCGRTTPIDLVTAHTTINISSQISGEDILVTWTPYGGCPISSYELYYTSPGDSFIFMASLPQGTLSYLDTTIICPFPVSYRVIATDLCGNTYTSYSDTSVTIPVNLLDSQVVNVVRSTVVDNQYVLTEWNQPLVHPEMVVRFEIYRSTDNENYYYLQTIPSLQTDYMDYDVDVQSEHYYYKILVINTCDISADMSDISTSILLKGEMDEARIVRLGWTPYEGWDTGVEYYIIEKKDENGNWQLLKRVDGNVLQHEFRE